MVLEKRSMLVEELLCLWMIAWHEGRSIRRKADHIASLAHSYAFIVIYSLVSAAHYTQMCITHTSTKSKALEDDHSSQLPAQGHLVGLFRSCGRIWHFADTRNDGRALVGQMLAYDKHMNFVLAECEEFRTIKAKKTKGDDSEPSTTQQKRTLGLVILRGETIVSVQVEGPPPVTAEEKGLMAGPGRGVAAGRGMPLGAGAPALAARPLAYAQAPPGFPPGMPGLPAGMPPGFPGGLPPGMPPPAG